MTTVALEKIEIYLERLRRQLQGLRNSEVNDIAEELRSHIVDKATVNGELAETGVDAALHALGDPENLAGEYITDAALARAEVSRSPIRILESLVRWASLSVGGFFVLLGALLGYFVGGALMWCAVLKPIHPHSAGLWILRDSSGDLQFSLRLGFGTAPMGAHDVLGWWIVPIGLLGGFGLVMLTSTLAIWCVRLYRKSWASRRATSH